MQTNEHPVLELVRNHYGNSNEPLFLATVGQFLRDQKLWPIEGEKRSLKDWLASFGADLLIVQDEASPARVAIVTKDKAALVEQTLLDLRNSQLVNTLARPVLLAFCVEGNDGGPVFLTQRPPFRYTLVTPPDPDAYYIIPADLRLPGLPLRTASRMQASDVAALGRNVRKWADQSGVALDRLTKASTETGENAQTQVSIGTFSALDRLIAAQRPPIRPQLVIPADIAALLSRHR